MSNRILSGIIVSDINNKTIVVSVRRIFKHKTYNKIIRKDKKYHVHDPENNYHKGQLVYFIPCRPVSKRKKWVVYNK